MPGDIECDVLLIGAGVGSMAAALVLKRAGLRALVVEKTGFVGGATAYSGGIVWAPGNFRMRAKGLADSPEQALAYLESVAGGRGDPAIAGAYVDAVPRIVEALQETTPLRWVTYPNLPDYHAELLGGLPAGRYLLPHGDLVRDALETAAVSYPALALVRPAVHLGERRNEWVWGRALAGCLWAQVLADEIPFLMRHRATNLLRDGNRVAGAEISDGRNVHKVCAARGVLLDTGGFEWDVEMDRKFVPGPRLSPQTPPSSEGDGHRMAARIGASFALMDQTIGMSSVCLSGDDNDGRQLYRILFQDLARPHGVLVNAAGRRFANETYFVDVARSWSETDADGRHPNLPCFLVFDAAYRGRYGMPGGLEERHFVTAPTLDALARSIAIDPDGLAGTVGTYNRHARSGETDDFGRGSTAYQRAFGDRERQGNPTVGEIERPPYFAIRIHPATSGHRGGVVIDAHARVLDTGGLPIKGLYACGAVAAGSLTGETYFTGTAVGHALVFGTLAAETIAHTKHEINSVYS